MPDTPTTEPDDQPQGATTHESDSTVLAWASLICGILAILSMPFGGGIPGCGVVAIITGVLVIRRPNVPAKFRRLAKIGIGLGIAKMVVWACLAAWIFYMIAIGPGLIAH
jgi:hypothetical protein